MEFQLFEKREEAVQSLLLIEQSLKELPALSLQELAKDNTAIVYVDIIKGFVSVGLLSSPRAFGILPSVQRLNEMTKGFHKIYFVDCHTDQTTEFSAYPPHCLAGTEEVEIVPELVVEPGENSHVIYKNCTNGFMAKEFQDWLAAHPEVTNVVVTGLVTDICVMTFALTLKTYFNQNNTVSRLIVPVSMVETFDLPATSHQADLMNVFALYNMKMNGIEVVSDITE